MRPEAPTILSLDQVIESELSTEQLLILADLRRLKPETIRRSATRFRRFARNLPIAIPRTSAAARSLDMALRIGLQLNCLHPTEAIAIHWSQVKSAGRLSLPMTVTFDDGWPEWYSECLELPQKKRRHRLSALPRDWFEDSLTDTSRCAPALQGALILLALTGCRPVEVKTSLVCQQLDRTTISFQCAKQAAGDPNAQPRYREFTLVEVGALGNWVRVLNKLLRTLPERTPFANIDSKSIENACCRISENISCPQDGKITASCYRNQFSADLKRDGISPEILSYCLGHTSIRMAKKYGVWQQGRTGFRSYLDTSNLREVSKPASPNNSNRPSHGY